MGDINLTSGNIKAPKSFMKRTISKKTQCLQKNQACIDCRGKDWANRNNQKYEESHNLEWLEGVFPHVSTFVGGKLMRKVVVRKATSQYLRGMEGLASMARRTSTIWRCFRLGKPFFVRMRTWNMMCNDYTLKEGMKFFIFTNPISLYCNNFLTKFSFSYF
jgi:hypothetical protein